MKRHFLMQCHKLEKFIPCWFYSEKRDGQQGFWDGGISRGMDCKDVPWAYTEKHLRYKVPPKATGLWSRYAQPIQAPDWWLDALPKVPLVGELYAGRGKYQLVESTVKKLKPIDDEWSKISYQVFDSPPLEEVFTPGTVDLPQMKLTIPSGLMKWCADRGCEFGPARPFRQFKFVLERLRELIEPAGFPLGKPAGFGPFIFLEDQVILESEEEYKEYLKNILSMGGEGVIARNPNSLWLPQRSKNCLKAKPFLDDEGEVIGYTEATAGSRIDGLTGALIIRYKDVTFKLGMGLTDEDRRFPPKVGSVVTFRYRELTDDGIPKDARFWRVRET